MIEFNPDGSIKIPGRIADAKSKLDEKFSREKIVRISKEVLSYDAPKKCLLKINVSPMFAASDFVVSTFNHWKQYCQTPVNLEKTGERSFEIIVGTSFRRCSECTSFVERFEGGIVKKGNCYFDY